MEYSTICPNCRAPLIPGLEPSQNQRNTRNQFNNNTLQNHQRLHDNGEEGLANQSINHVINSNNNNNNNNSNSSNSSSNNNNNNSSNNNNNNSSSNNNHIIHNNNNIRQTVSRTFFSTGFLSRFLPQISFEVIRSTHIDPLVTVQHLQQQQQQAASNSNDNDNNIESSSLRNLNNDGIRRTGSININPRVELLYEAQIQQVQEAFPHLSRQAIAQQVIAMRGNVNLALNSLLDQEAN